MANLIKNVFSGKISTSLAFALIALASILPITGSLALSAYPVAAAPAVQAGQSRVLGLTTYPSASLVNDGGTIYFICGSTKIPFTNWQAFVGLGYSSRNVITGDLSGYTLSQTYMISTANAAHPWCSWLNYNGTIYYSASQGLIGVPNSSVFFANGGAWNLVVPANKYDVAILKANPNLPTLTLNDTRLITTSQNSGSQLGYDTTKALAGTGSTATISISNCQEITQSGNYVVTTDLNAPQTASCLNVHDTSNVIIDCQNHTINIDASKSNSITNADVSFTNVNGFTLKSCKLQTTNVSNVYYNFANTLSVKNSSNGTISQNIMGDGRSGISQNSSRITVSNNSFSFVLFVQNASSVNVLDNTFTLNSAINTVSLLVFQDVTGGQISNNSIRGGWDGVFGSTVGADDGILISGVSQTIIQNNNISNNYDCGIESLALIDSVQILSNLITNSGSCGIGGWYASDSWKNNLILGNTIDRAALMFQFMVASSDGTQHPIYFQNNRFIENKFSNPSDPTIAYSAYFEFGNNFLPTDISPSSLVIGNNLFQGNDFSTLHAPLIEPGLMAVDGGRNVCGASTQRDFPLNCVSSTTPTPTPTPTGPKISSISPSSGQVGSLVTISGTGFKASSNVIMFDSVATGAHVLTTSATSTGTTMTFTVPANLSRSCIVSGSCYSSAVAPGTYYVNVWDSNKSLYENSLNAKAFTVGGTITGAPTATLTGNNQTNFSVNIGDVINYVWSSANANYWTSDVYKDKADACQVGTGPFAWDANTSSGSASGIVQSCQAGVTYTINYYAKNTSSGVTAKSTITIRVNQTSTTNTPPSFSLRDAYAQQVNTAFSIGNLTVTDAQGGHLDAKINWGDPVPGTTGATYADMFGGESQANVPANLSVPSHTYTQAGNYIITVTVMDSGYLSTTKTVPIQITSTQSTLPTATLTANGGQTNFAVNVGDTINYTWNSTNANYWTSDVYKDKADACQVGTGPFVWVANTGSGSSSGIVQSCQAGVTYTINYYAKDTTSGVTTKSTITIRVNSVAATNAPRITSLRGYNSTGYTSTISSNQYLIIEGSFNPSGNYVTVAGQQYPPTSTYQSVTGINVQLGLLKGTSADVTVTNSNGTSNTMNIPIAP